MAPGTKPGDLCPRGALWGQWEMCMFLDCPWDQASTPSTSTPALVTGPSRVSFLEPGRLGLAEGEAGSDPGRVTQLCRLCKPLSPPVFSTTAAVAWAQLGGCHCVDPRRRVQWRQTAQTPPDGWGPGQAARAWGPSWA